MKRQIIKILAVVWLFGCNNIDYKPKYKDFANAWERENLIGKVKKLSQYKAIVSDFKTGKTDPSVAVFTKEFSEAGNILYQENFDHFGKLSFSIKHKYDNNGYRSETVTENFDLPGKTIEKVNFDTVIGNQRSLQLIANDSLKMTLFFQYDEHKNPVEQTQIEQGDTTLTRLEYKYDGEGRILFKKQLDRGDSGINETISEFTYDAYGNLLELMSKSEVFGEIKSTYEYDSENRIKKITEYQNGQVNEETSFDKYYNKMLVRFYQDQKPDKEMKYEYEFDKKGNWVQRKVYMKEHPGDKKSVLVYKETREIEYYD